MSGGKNNPEHLFYLAGWHHIKHDDYNYYTKDRGNGRFTRQLQIGEYGNVYIDEMDNDLNAGVNSIILTQQDIKALYFKLRSLGFCKDEKKEKKK